MSDPFRHFLDLDDELLWLRWDKFWQCYGPFVVIGFALITAPIVNMMWR